MRHLVLRGNTYHYRRRVPKDIQELVGRTFWKQSLKTGSLREAEKRARALGVHYDEGVRQLCEMPDLDKKHYRYGALQGRFFEKTAAAVQAHNDGADSSVFAPLPAMEEAAKGAKQEFDDAMEAKAPGCLKAMDDLRDLQYRREVEPYERMVLNGQHVADIPKHLESRFLLSVSEINKMTPIKKQVKLDLLEDEADLRAKKEKRLKKALKPVENSLAVPRYKEDPTNPRILSATETWFQKRGQGDLAVNRHRVAVRRFAELFNNPVISEITREMVVTFVNAISDLTDHRKLPSSDRGSLAKVDGLPKVSAKTVERHLITIKALLTFCVSEGWIANNVTTGIPLPKDDRPKASKRRGFNKDELKQLLDRAVEEFGEDGDMTWLIKLAAYTGCRLEELGQLATHNVREVDGVWVIEIDDLDGRHVKTETSVRNVPLHPAIREEFVKWVNDNPGKRVFASFKRKNGRFANQLSGDFGRLMDRAGLEDSRLVFHSLRHMLKRAMSNARVDIEVRKAILGHASNDAHGGYEGHSLAAMAEELGRVPALY